MKKILLTLSLPVLAFINSKAGCGGVCIFSSPTSSYYGINDTVILNQGSTTLYANYNDCCNLIFGNNVSLVWCLNGVSFDTTSVGTVSNYMYTQQIIVNQTGVYTVYFIDFVYPNSPSYTCGSITVLTESSSPSSASEYDPKVSDVFLYPNPVKNELTIGCCVSGNTITGIKIFSQNGAEVFSSEENSESSSFTKTIDVSGFAPGIYFVKIQTAEGIETKKLVKL